MRARIGAVSGRYSRRRAGPAGRASAICPPISAQHVMGRLMFDVIGAHDRDRYAIHLYSLASPRWPTTPTDALPRAGRPLRRAAAGAISTRRARSPPTTATCSSISMGHTMFSRPEILACKPARRIVTHLGSHGAIGLSQVDFKLTDRYADVADAGRLPDRAAAARWRRCVLPFRRARRRARRRRLARGARHRAGGARAGRVRDGAEALAALPRACGGRSSSACRGAVLLFSPIADAEHAGFRRQLAGYGIDPRARVVVHPAGERRSTARRATHSSTSSSTRCPTRGATRRWPRSMPAFPSSRSPERGMPNG